MCSGAEEFLTRHADKVIMASSALNAVGRLVGGKQASNFQNYQANQAEADADAEQQLGRLRAGKIRKAGARTGSQARAAYGASGVSVDSGTARAVQQQIDADVAEDALTELLTGGYRAQSLRATAEGRRRAARNSEVESYFGAGKSLLAGAATVMEKRAERDRWRRRKEADELATQRYLGTGPYSYDQEFTP